MNKDHEIYKALEEEIPEEDKARLDGYLAARAEIDELARLRRAFDKAEAAAQKNAKGKP